MFENLFMLFITFIDSDPPKSPLERGTLMLYSPLKRGILMLYSPLAKGG